MPELLLPNGKPYANTENCWQSLQQASKAARYLGLVNFADLSDHKNPEPHLIVGYQTEPNARFWLYTPELTDPLISINGGDGFNLAMVQPYHLEVWAEKSTMNDVLLPVCRRFGANLVTGEGEISLTAVHALSERVREANKPARIFYVSDFDPAGMSMPCAAARKLEFLTTDTSLDIKLTRLLLNREHVERFKLPRIPIKESERRAAAFEANYGEGAVELDALEALRPGKLSRVVSEALGHYYSGDAAREARLKERELQQAIRRDVSRISARYADQIEALQAMNLELAKLELSNIEDFEPEQAEPAADDGAFQWLFDSDRDYLTQVSAYKAYLRGDHVNGLKRASV